MYNISNIYEIDSFFCEYKHLSSDISRRDLKKVFDTETLLNDVKSSLDSYYFLVV